MRLRDLIPFIGWETVECYWDGDFRDETDLDGPLGFERDVFNIGWFGSGISILAGPVRRQGEVS